MIYTSYFENLKALPKCVVPISICGKTPDWYTGLQYRKLAPKLDFFTKWKENQDNDYYTKCFSEQVLNKLDVHQVVDALYQLLPEEERTLLSITNCPPWNNPYIHIALICYEKPEEFCHRHLVAEWLSKNGIKCKEWQTKET